jgi:hypothetical protein
MIITSLVRLFVCLLGRALFAAFRWVVASICAPLSIKTFLRLDSRCDKAYQYWLS